MGWSGERHEFLFDDAAAAKRGAARLRLVAKQPTPKQRALLTVEAGLEPGAAEPASADALRRLLARCAGSVKVGSIKQDGAAVRVGFDHDDDHDAGASDPETPGIPTTSQVRAALEAYLKDLGGFTKPVLAAQAMARARARALADVTDTPADLLARLEAARDRLLRYEKVFVDTLRTAVAANAVLDGQRLQAVKILERLGAPDRAP